MSEGPSRLQLAYVGLGNVGLPVARYLATYPQQSKLKVWNRTKDEYNLIPEAEGVDSISDLFADTEDEGVMVVFTSLANDAAVLEIYDRLIREATDHARGKVIFVDQSTVHPDTATRLEEDARLATPTGRLSYLSSPVIGQPAAAASRQMVCLVAGDPTAVEIVKPVLGTIGRATMVIGKDVAQASKTKLFVNMMLYESIHAFSEVYALADATEFPVDVLHEVFQTVLPAPPLVNYSNKISKGLFDGSTGFKVDGGLKDVQHILSLREGLTRPLPLPTLERVEANFIKAKNLQDGTGGSLGVESLSAIIRLQGGMPAFKQGSDLGKGEGE